MVRDIVRVALFGFGQRHLAIEAHHRIGLTQLRVHAHPPVEDETFAIIVGAAAFLEILENSPIELEDIFKTLSFHQWTRFFATDATRTKQNERLGFEFGI